MKNIEWFAIFFILSSVTGAVLTSWLTIFLIKKIIQALDVYIQSGG